MQYVDLDVWASRVGWQSSVADRNPNAVIERKTSVARPSPHTCACGIPCRFHTRCIRRGSTCCCPLQVCLLDLEYNLPVQVQCIAERPGMSETGNASLFVL